jgi:hypothetical protein
MWKNYLSGADQVLDIPDKRSSAVLEMDIILQLLRCAIYLSKCGDVCMYGLCTEDIELFCKPKVILTCFKFCDK